MSKIIISDTSCLIALDRINQLEILQKTFNTIITTNEVQKEFGKPLPAWISINEVRNTNKVKELEYTVDKGEASAIALAIELASSLLILDDLEARHLAKQLNLTHTGTLGIILRAKRTGHIKSVKPIIEKMKNTNFSISAKLYQDVLIEANEAG